MNIKELPFLVNALRERDDTLNMPKNCLLLGAGCSYRSKIPLGAHVTELLKMEAFKKDFIANKVDFIVTNNFVFDDYKKQFDKYLEDNKLTAKYNTYIKDKRNELEKEVDALKPASKRLIFPSKILPKKSVDETIEKTLILPKKSDEEAIEKIFQEHKQNIYNDYEYGFWFKQFSNESNVRAELIDKLIHEKETGYGYVALANIINQDYIRNIFTTNFDDLLNEALLLYFFKKSKIIAHAKNSEHINFLTSKPNIIKLHGNYLFTDLRNTIDETDNNPLTNKMQLAFNTFGLIVLGYGGADYAIMNALEEAKEYSSNNEYKLIWCDRKKPEDLHWRVKHLLDNTKNSYYIQIESFDVLMVQINDVLNLPNIDIKETAEKRQTIYDTFLSQARNEIKGSSLDENEKTKLDQKLNAEDYFNKGNKANTPEDKIKWYKKAIELNPNNDRVFNNLGTALYELKRNEEAIEIYLKAIELNPNNDRAFNNLGTALDELKRNEEAIEKYQKAIELNPYNIDAFNNYGLALSDLGRNEEAIEKYQKAIELNPNDDKAYNGLGIALDELKRNEEAIEKYQKVIELNPNNSNAYNNLGASLYKLGKYKEAIEKYEKAIEINPNNDKAYYNIGIALSDLGRNEEAIEKYQKAIELNPTDYKVYYNLGISLSALGRNEEAIEKYEKAIDLNPTITNAYYNLGKVLIDISKIEEAIAILLKGESIKEGSCLYNLACAYNLNNQTTEALTTLEKLFKDQSEENKSYTRQNIIEETDFKSLQEFPKFKELLNKYRPT